SIEAPPDKPLTYTTPRHRYPHSYNYRVADARLFESFAGLFANVRLVRQDNSCNYSGSDHCRAQGPMQPQSSYPICCIAANQNIPCPITTKSGFSFPDPDRLETRPVVKYRRRLIQHVSIPEPCRNNNTHLACQE